MEQLEVIWTAAFFGLLFLATVFDLTENRIPNFITLAAIVLGVVVNISSSTLVDGLISSVSGFLVCFFIFIPFYALGGMGAGDVKLMAAAGAVLGFQGGALAVAYTLMFGALMGFAVLVWKSGIASVLSRYLYTLNVLVKTGTFISLPVGEASPLKQRFPYAMAIAIGAAASALSTGRVVL